MLYRKNGEWALSPFKVIYIQNGETLEHYTDDKQWWVDFAERWDHTEIIEFVEVPCSSEEKARLEEVKHVDEGFEYYASRYVIDGLFPDELEEEERLKEHPFQTLQLKKESEHQGQMITGSQLESMDQGQKQTDFEIRLLLQEVK